MSSESVPKLFEGYPVLQDDVLILRKMIDTDADALGALAHNETVYRYLPTFLFEQKYDDAHEVLRKMDEECFDTKESLFLGVCLREDPDTVIGIGEIYNYEADKFKASIGYRFNEQYWNHGYATRAARLLRDYLVNDSGIRTITAHVMKENGASARVLVKNDFLLEEADLWEDWGFGHDVLVDKYSYIV